MAVTDLNEEWLGHAQPVGLVVASTVLARLDLVPISQMASWLQSPFLLFVRLYWGWQFMTDGWGKLHNLARVTELLHLARHPRAGHQRALRRRAGVLRRPDAHPRACQPLHRLLLTCNMFVAYYTAERDALKSIFSDPDKFTGADRRTTFFFASLIILIFGAGAISVDHLLRHHFEKKRLERQSAT